MKKQILIIILSMVIGMVFFSTANAGTCIWEGSISNNWSNPNNWLDGIVPGVDDDVIFDWNALNDCVLDVTTSIKGLTIDNFDYLLTIPSGSNLSISGDLYIGVTYQNWDNNADIIFNGDSDQFVYLSNPVNYAFDNLIINKSTGEVILQSDVVVNGCISYINGTINNDIFNIIGNVAPKTGGIYHIPNNIFN